MQLALERCTIRDWRLDDAASLAKHANNRRVWLGVRDLFPHPYRVSNANEFLRRAITAQPMTNFCIDIDQSAVGSIGIRIGQDVHRRVAELGFWLGEEFWGTEVIPAFVDYCLQKFPLHRIYAEPTRIITLQLESLRRPVSFWRDACEKTLSKTDRFSIRSFTRRFGSTAILAVGPAGILPAESCL